MCIPSCRRQISPPDVNRKQIWAEAEAEKEALARAIETYQVKGLKKAEKGDVREAKWNGMMKQVQSAVKLYENEPMTGAKGKIKWALHKIRDGSKTMEHWCNLLPGGDYGGTIAGVFSILASVCQIYTGVGIWLAERLVGSKPLHRSTRQYLRGCTGRPRLYQSNWRLPRYI